MSPFRIVSVLFLIVPVIEIYLFIKVGGLIGVLPTLLLVLGSAVLGIALLRHQGFATLARVQTILARGEIPAIEVLEGITLFVGALLLLIPGLFTDLIGILCLIPPLRRQLIILALRRGIMTTRRMGGRPRDQGERTLEGEYWRDDGRR